MTEIFDLSALGALNDGCIIFNKSFAADKVFDGKRDSFLISAVASFNGLNSPHICFSITVKGQAEPVYSSHYYVMGGCNEFIKQSFRIPFLFRDEMKLTVSVQIPDGTVLQIKEFGIDEGGEAEDVNPNVRYNAHLGLWGMAPDNTVPSFELAGLSGFKSCIAVPKVTKDSVIVCIHDDTINRTARDCRGNPPGDKVFVKDKTYKELLEWEYGSYKNPIYKGVFIPTLSQFFDICEQFGMSPMFSTHPSLDVSQWEQVKSEVDSRNLLKRFHIKGFGLDTLKSAFSVFSDEIDGYTLDSRNFDSDLLRDFFNSDIAKSDLRIGFEIPFGKYTSEIAEEITGRGFFAAAYSIKQRYIEEYKRLISYGVTEFTEDLHCPVI